MDNFVNTVLFEMDLQVEYGNEVFVGEWTIFYEDDSDDEDQIRV